MQTLLNTPIPKDIPLPFPLPEGILATILVISFLLHIIFIHLMVGGSMVALWAQIKGLGDKKFDEFAHEVAKTITVNKSLAVVLGVAPLLSINALYTIYFYSANALTGFAWILIIPLVTIAFLLTYLHKYTWHTLEGNKRIHISILATAVAIFLIIPLIFLTNVNLMMFPEKWGAVKGFLSALMLPNVLPRYFEFIGASIAVTGIFLVWYNSRKNYPVEQIYQGQFTRYSLKKLGYSIALLGLGLQILFGLIVLFTLPSKGVGFDVIIVMSGAGLLLVAALWFAYKAITAQEWAIDKYLPKVVPLMLLFMVFYGASRQLYRQKALHKHQELMAAHTAEFIKLSKEARESASQNDATATAALTAEGGKGAAIFKTYCAACHKQNEKLVGPPITEMVSIYQNNAEGLKQWIKAPGKKRPDYPQMPGFAQLSPEELNELSNYILSVK